LDRGQLYRLCRSAEEAAPLMVDFFRYFDPIHWLVFLVLRFRGSSHIDTSINLVLRSALLRASRRTATSETEPAAILRDGASRLLRVGLIINAHVFRPLRDAEKVHECWQGGPTPRRSRLFSRNPWRAVGIG